MIEIARAGQNDLEIVCGLFADYLRFYGRTHDATAIRDYLRERIERGESVLLLARNVGEAFGFVQLYPSFAGLSLCRSWILHDLFVREDARRQGIAEALLLAAREFAETGGAAEIFLQTARDNLPAQRLYESLGYARDDEFLVYTLSLPRHDPIAHP
jgi:ribosomal protein S18 acetylase RimI-like enzyme